jgi:head-tail adaptor
MTPKSDGAGGHAEQWSDMAKVWALVEPASAQHCFGTDGRLPELTPREGQRFCRHMRSLVRFLHGGSRRRLIRMAHAPDGMGQFLLCRTANKALASLSVEKPMRLLRLPVHQVTDRVRAAKRKPRRWALRGRPRTETP